MHYVSRLDNAKEDRVTYGRSATVLADCNLAVPFVKCADKHLDAPFADWGSEIYSVLDRYTIALTGGFND